MDSISENSEHSELRQSLERLLQTDFQALQADIGQLQARIEALEALSSPLPEDIQCLRESVQELALKSEQMGQAIHMLQDSLSDPPQAAGIVRLGLASALHKEIQTQTAHYSDIIAPVISPAISNQIRNARPEMIAALYPIIGQTISKAIAEAMQDLRRRIDANMKRGLNIRQRLYRVQARLRGVPAADLVLRESLDYRVRHVFLIHRQTGLLIQQLSGGEAAQDTDIFSAMLTAIRDFARDTFGSSDEDLEEIQYGESHILLRNGLYSYLAVVMDGVQPEGYAALMLDTVHQVNLKYGEELSRFSGDMSEIHDYQAELAPLFNPSPQALESASAQAALSRGQKIAVGSAIAAAVILLALAVFACIFTTRLLPVAFPGPTQTAAPTFTHTPTQVPPTHTPTPTLPPTATLIPTLTPTAAPTPTLPPTATIQAPLLSTTTGNIWARLEPEPSSQFFQSAVQIDTPVEILAIYGKWVKIAWQTGGSLQQGWIPAEWVALPEAIPAQIITPEQ